ncbi:uncharacterized protein BDR25DRAFT_98668 [Lindgomyces ingoldianus]|uniref:Uncharacterized protein n=1 Tax=Lindgomyces ingoldianus TaxID=673940 RepID=A0ACB6QCQ7_9PLEO|nr:uncharacterized protein BDR25DRAFT_98668 [Lindgomyces ingoldianus]KAF2464157.1 hypothetical protein BDR25DRAFT_98668 [Lindgomyces ingoldianus]
MHPIIYLVSEFILTVFVVGFTHPTSRLRLIALLPVALCMVCCIPQCMPYMIRTPWAALVGGYAVTYLYHYVDVALLSRWSFRDNAPVSGLVRPSSGVANTDKVSAEKRQRIVNNTVLARFHFGFKVTSSFRFVGTPYEVRNTPRPLEVGRKERTHFLMRTFAAIATSYTLLDLINSMNDPTIAAKYLGLDKIPLLTRLRDVSAEELVIRFFTVLAAGIGLNCVQGGIYHVFALVSVALNLSDPQDWPPFYGSPRDTYTLRSFWNVFWHQTNARKFSSIAHYTVHNSLNLPRGTVVARYLRILVAFLSSGVMHMLDDIASGITLENSGAMSFFLVQVLGLVAEDIVIRAYGSSTARMPRAAERSVGFLWVSIFLTWSVPAYMYPMMWRTNQGLNDSTIPYSLFGSGAERFKASGLLSCAGMVALSGTLINGDNFWTG